ncbi:MAG: hypothetical protein HOV94_11875, partial [Saccharothrix sp.]|nr:hypothetical protein [Saccharothrix sp.]
LSVDVDARAVRRAWDAASRGRVIGVAGDGSAEAALITDEVRRLVGPRDRVVVDLPLTETVVQGAADQGADVVVLVSATPIAPLTRGVSRQIRVVAVGFGAGACAPSTALSAAAKAHGGRCHEVVAANGATASPAAVLDDIASAAWGG